MATNSMIKPCDICGDHGVIDAIIICSKCKVSREHLYCMRVYTTQAPPWWRCDECDQDKLVSPRTSDNEPKTQKTPLVREGENNNRVSSQFTFKEKWVDKGRTKYLSCDEAVKLSSGSIKLSRFQKEVRSPPCVFQQATGLKEKTTPPVCERTHIKSPKEDRSVKPNSQQPVVQQSFSPKEKATPPACERTHLKSPKEAISVKPNSQQPIVQRSFSPKEKATSPACERTHIKSPKEARSVEPNSQQPVAQQPFSQKEKATPPACERKHIKSPKEDRSVKPNLQRPIVQQSFSPKEKAALPSRRVEGTNPEREIQTTKNGFLPSQKEADIGRYIEVPKSAKERVNTETTSGCKNYVDVAAQGFNAGLASGLLVSKMHDPYIPSLNSYWKGCFYLPNGPQKFNEAFEAHPPSRIHYKVYETTKKLPENIYFELVSSHEIRMDIFPADRDDIGLYFFPMYKQRSENDISIINYLWRNNLVMKSDVEGVELFVLSSRVLPSHAQEFEGNYFLWGVFRRPKTAKKVSDTLPLMAANREPCDDVPPGFKRICNDDDVPPGFKRICKR